MSPVTRRQSMRLVERADREAESETPALAPAPAPSQKQPANKRDSIVSTVSGGRVTKPEPKGRVIASRYMSAANPRKPEPTSTARARPTTPAVAPASARARAGSVASAAELETAGANRSKAKPMVTARPMSRQATSSVRRPAASSRSAVAETKSIETPDLADRRASRRDTRRDTRRETSAMARTGAPLDTHELAAPPDTNTGLHATFLQWQLIEARSRVEFEESKAAVTEELNRLAQEAEQAKRALMDEQRKLKLMREYAALSTWLAANKETLADMGAQISKVSEPYTKFSEQLAQTTRAMPISGVYFKDGESLVSDMQGFVDAVEQNFSKDAMQVQDLFKMASRLNQYYKALAQERELISECDRLRQSLEHTAVLAISSKLGRDDAVNRHL